MPLTVASSFQGQPSAYAKSSDPLKQSKNFTGEVFFDDVTRGDGNRKQRVRFKYFQKSYTSPSQRRRRTVYSTRRNLHCHMCGVTETPEWRRGPAGDHTLCNACGLHYAKSLKRQRKERDARKHSIDMLLNDVSFSSCFILIPNTFDFVLQQIQPTNGTTTTTTVSSSNITTSPTSPQSGVRVTFFLLVAIAERQN